MPDNNLTTLQQQPQTQYIYVQRPAYPQEDVAEIDLFELFHAVWKRKKFIFLVTFIFACASLAYSLYLPFIYRAECRFVPPSSGGQGGRLAALAAQYGGIASMMGVNLSGKATTGGMLLGIMKGDTVVDAIMDKFNLMEENEWEYRINARKAVLENLEAKEEVDSGIVSVAYLDEDPNRAADIANAFVDELRRKLLDISIEDAQQSRIFYENQLMQAQKELTDAEDAMIRYQQSTGVIVPTQQASALLGSINSLRARIANKNIDIASLSLYTTEDNPRLKLAQTELESMQKELRQLEAEQQRTTGRKSSEVSAGEIPELGVEYQRYYRAVTIAGAKYQLMLRQYDSAKLAEASDLSTITIIDPAMPPDYKYKPSRARICILGTFFGGFLASCWAAFPNLKKQMLAGRPKKDYDDDEDDDD